MHGEKAPGFSLLELLVSMAVLMLITAVAVSTLSGGLKTVRRERNLANRDAQVKRAVELISLELAQAGVTPEFTNNPDPLIGTGPLINGDITIGATTIPLSSTRGLYPGRPVTLTLPDGSANSEVKVISDLSSTSIDIAAGAEKSHAFGDAISSPMLPNIFAILNPPSGTQKTVTRLGIMGDILGNNSLQYIEYKFENDSLYRSITPIDGVTVNKGEYELWPCASRYWRAQMSLMRWSKAVLPVIELLPSTRKCNCALPRRPRCYGREKAKRHCAV